MVFCHPEKTLGGNLVWWKEIEKTPFFVIQQHKVGPPVNLSKQYRILLRDANNHLIATADTLEQILEDWEKGNSAIKSEFPTIEKQRFASIVGNNETSNDKELCNKLVGLFETNYRKANRDKKKQKESKKELSQLKGVIGAIGEELQLVSEESSEFFDSVELINRLCILSVACLDVAYKCVSNLAISGLKSEPSQKFSSTEKAPQTDVDIMDNLVKKLTEAREIQQSIITKTTADVKEKLKKDASDRESISIDASSLSPRESKGKVSFNGIYFVPKSIPLLKSFGDPEWLSKVSAQPKQSDISQHLGDILQQTKHPIGKKFRTFLNDFDSEKLLKTARTSSYGQFSSPISKTSAIDGEEAQLRFSSCLEYFQNWIAAFHTSVMATFPSLPSDIVFRTVQDLAIDRLYTKLFAVYKEKNKQELNLYSLKMEELKEVTWNHLMDTPNSTYTLEATNALKKITDTKSIFNKISCIQNTCKCIAEGKKTETGESVSSEELLNTLIYVIIKSKVNNLIIEVRMMIDLLPNTVMMGEEGFVLATLETAVNITLGLSYQKLQEDLVAKQNRIIKLKNEKAESSLKVEIDAKLVDYYRDLFGLSKEEKIFTRYSCVNQQDSIRGWLVITDSNLCYHSLSGYNIIKLARQEIKSITKNTKMLNHAIFIVTTGGSLYKFRYFLNRGEAYNTISAFLDFKPNQNKQLEKDFVVL